jgi:hypothetical protein
MQRFEACCGSKDVKTSGCEFSNSIEFGFVQNLVFSPVFFSNAEAHGADIR